MIRRAVGGVDIVDIHVGIEPPANGYSQAMPDDTTSVRDLLHEAAETHHVVYRITDGEDADWASWYADWLLNQSELPSVLGSRPVRSALVYELVRLDREYTAEPRSEPWEDYYARALVGTFGPPAGVSGR
jgi:hypothetical protein